MKLCIAIIGVALIYVSAIAFQSGNPVKGGAALIAKAHPKPTIIGTNLMTGLPIFAPWPGANTNTPPPILSFRLMTPANTVFQQSTDLVHWVHGGIVTTNGLTIANNFGRRFWRSIAACWVGCNPQSYEVTVLWGTNSMDYSWTFELGYTNDEGSNEWRRLRWLRPGTNYFNAYSHTGTGSNEQDSALCGEIQCVCTLPPLLVIYPSTNAP